MTEDKLKTVGSQVVSGTVNNFIARAEFIEKVEIAGVADVRLLKDQEGEGSSSNKVQENPSFLGSVNSFFEPISDMTDIPLSELEGMYAVRALDLSNRCIESLPDTISNLVELRQLLLRGDEILMELPANIGALKHLEVLDLEGTELICLPEEIGYLFQLECLKVSLYRYADWYIQKKIIKAIIPTGALSNLRSLKELSIHVDPDCEWWDEEARTIIKELPKLTNLKILKLYFPTDEILQQFLQLPINVYTSLSNFRLIVGRHELDIVICLPDDLQSEYEKSEKCLKYVNREGNTDVVGKALEHAKSLFLDRHWTFEKLSVFKIQEMTLLVCCLIVECNMMKTIIDGSDFYKEGDNATANDRKPALELLRYLSVHQMKNLQCIWKGPIVTGCLSNLEILALHTCPELITIFNPMLLRNLVNLKELIIKDCPKIQSLVNVEPGLLEIDHAYLPSLQTILLVHLPELLSIFSGLIIPQKLQKIVVYNCPKLDNLSPEDKYSKYLRKVEDENQCSKALDLSSNETDYLHHVFVHLMDRLKQSGNSFNQPSLKNQAARTEGLIINKDLLKEDKGLIINKDMLKEDNTKQGLAFPSALDRLPSSVHHYCVILWIRSTLVASYDLSCMPGVPPYQYGIFKPPNNVSIVSVCGVSGIGKTTIAKSIYNSNYDKFEGSCFLSNIGEYSRKPGGLLRLQEQLLSSILPKKKKEGTMNIYDINDGILLIRNAIRCERVLIVLDDVDELSQLHALIGNRDWYCSGSKIIVTTRQMQLLKRYKVHNQYMVGPLDEEESLRLFSLHAFGSDYPVTGYEDFARRFAIRCGGLPLALVVLGSYLSSSDISVYRSVIEKIEFIPQHEVINMLKVSLDSIHHNKEKDLFLHIACFFLGKDANHVTTILNEHGFNARTGIQTLVHRRLLTIDRDSKLQMHQLLQDMGRDIVREESPEQRRRLKCHEVAVNVLTETTTRGIEDIKGRVLNFIAADEPLTCEKHSNASSSSA
ncbi:hypothetical protein LguiA_026566 [Lonicera macranthoides]